MLVTSALFITNLEMNSFTFNLEDDVNFFCSLDIQSGISVKVTYKKSLKSNQIGDIDHCVHVTVVVTILSVTYEGEGLDCFSTN